MQPPPENIWYSLYLLNLSVLGRHKTLYLATHNYAASDRFTAGKVSVKELAVPVGHHTYLRV